MSQQSADATVTVLLLQVNESLAEAAARTAAQAWHRKDVVSSLGALKLIQMLGFPGKQGFESRLPQNRSYALYCTTSCTCYTACHSSGIVQAVACIPTCFNAHACNTAQLLLCVTNFAAIAQASFGVCHFVFACLSQTWATVSAYDDNGSGVVQHTVAGFADTTSSMQCLTEPQPN